jgi:CHAT domain-containing protein
MKNASAHTSFLLITAAVCVVAGVGFISVFKIRDGRSTNIRALADAAGTTRATEGRISGFPYRPPTARVRGGSRIDAANWKLYAATAKLKQVADQTPTVENLHAFGVAFLIAGSASEAVETMLRALALETGEADDPKAAIARSRNASLLTDFSVALQERAAALSQSEDRLLSVAAADRAHRLDPRSPETAWNRAVTIERLHLQALAIEAWRDYLAVERDRQWLQEARAHLQTLDVPTDADRWTHALALFVRTAAASDAAALARFPSRSFDYCESLLIDWAEAAIRRDRQHAERTLNAARVLAAAITRETGDGMLEESVNALAGPGADAAVSQYGRAKNIRTSRSITDSVGALRAAEEALGKVRIPLALRAAVSVASAEYESHDHAGALRTLAAISQPALRRYPLESAHAARVFGLAKASLGYADDAREAYLDARKIYERVSDPANVGSIDLLLADNAQYAGDWPSTWRYYESSLENTVAHGDRGKQLLLYGVMARSTSRAGYFSVSLLLQNQVIGILERTDKPAYLCQLLITRGETKQRLGLIADAGADAARAVQAYERIPDPAVKKRLIGDLSMLIASASPADPASFRRVDEAIAAATETKDHFRLARLHLLRGRQRMRIRSVPAAEADFHQGIAEFEAQRERLASDDDRIMFLETARELFNELIRLLVASGRSAEAFDIAEERSARVLQDHLVGQGADAQKPVRSELRADDRTRLVRLLPDGDAVHAWITDGRGAIAYAALRVPHLRRRVAAAVDELEHVDGSAPTRELDSLSHDLLNPLVARFEGADHLIVIADDELAMLPFPALRDPASGKYLVERFAIASSSSVRAYLRGRDAVRRPQSLLFVHVPRPPQVLSSGMLPPLTSDEHTLFAAAAKHFAQSRFVDGPSATAGAFLQRMRRADVIHFSGHAIERIPGQVSLVLMPDADHPDGLLSADVLSSTPVPPGAVVVLAACRTNTGRISSDGVMSLARSFLLAGSSSVVATSWDVDDEASTAFLQLFYAHFDATRDVAASLRATQIEFAHSTRYRAPRYWAAFGITGGA